MRWEKIVAGKGRGMNYGIGRATEKQNALFFLLVCAAVAIWARMRKRETRITEPTAPLSWGNSTNATGVTTMAHLGRRDNDKTSYAPGEAVTVTFTGGGLRRYRRWRLDPRHPLSEQRGNRQKHGHGLPTQGWKWIPITFSTTAPAAAGTYTYQAAWFGNLYDSGNTTTANQANRGYRQTHLR